MQWDNIYMTPPVRRVVMHAHTNENVGLYSGDRAISINLYNIYLLKLSHL